MQVRAEKLTLSALNTVSVEVAMVGVEHGGVKLALLVPSTATRRTVPRRT